MNPIVASRKSLELPALVGRILDRLAAVRKSRPKLRRVDIGAFSPHLQRDMGFLDGHPVPGREPRRGRAGAETRDAWR